ncbi:hypothetical protein [uncultured Lacinutrix sp.]|uniref:hypothetical protein n=1 Tax=uncultured Lacinutrix sp. TaxID=574032 RepID=UPI002634B0AA|nr:hypothetical protein [uncultured Lacinutrix sp.]
MKRYILFFTLIVSICLLACEDYSPKDHNLSVIIDRSEAHSYAPISDDITTYLGDTNATDAISISLSYISDTRYASKYSFNLDKAETGWLSNEDKRRKSRRLFFKQFGDSLRYYNTQQKPLLRSAIFSVVLGAIEEASKKNSPYDILLFSDLKEHSALFSVYDVRFKRKLLQDIDATTEALRSHIQLPKNLSGVTLHIIYKPSIEESPVFTAMVTLYKAMIESRGGKVIVGRHIKIGRNG